MASRSLSDIFSLRAPEVRLEDFETATKSLLIPLGFEKRRSSIEDPTDKDYKESGKLTTLENTYGCDSITRAYYLSPSMTNADLLEAWFIFRRLNQRILRMSPSSRNAPEDTSSRGWFLQTLASGLEKTFIKVFQVAIAHTTATLTIHHQTGLFIARIDMPRNLSLVNMYNPESVTEEGLTPEEKRLKIAFDLEGHLASEKLSPEQLAEQGWTGLPKGEKFPLSSKRPNAYVSIRNFDDMMPGLVQRLGLDNPETPKRSDEELRREIEKDEICAPGVWKPSPYLRCGGCHDQITLEGLFSCSRCRACNLLFCPKQGCAGYHNPSDYSVWYCGCDLAYDPEVPVQEIRTAAKEKMWEFMREIPKIREEELEKKKESEQAE